MKYWDPLAKEWASLWQRETPAHTFHFVRAVALYAPDDLSREVEFLAEFPPDQYPRTHFLIERRWIGG